MEHDEYMTVAEVARAFRVHPITIRREIRAGNLPANLVGGQFRILRRDFEEYKQRTRIPRAKPEEETVYGREAKPAA